MIVNGPNSGGSTSPWDHTFVIPTQLPPGNVTALGLDAAQAGNHKVKVARRDNGNTYEIVLDQPISHQGNGWQDEVVSFTVPSTGEYFMACFVDGTVARSVNAARAIAGSPTAGLDVPQGVTQAFYVDGLGMPVMRAHIDEAAPDPDLGPDPSGDDYLVMVEGQSNAMNWYNQGGAAACIAEFATLTGKTLQIVSGAVGGASIDKWLGASSIRANAVAAFNAAIPNAIPLAILSLRGENEGTTAEKAIAYATSQAELLDTIKSELTLPAGRCRMAHVITELFTYPGSIRPHWGRVQDQQRLLCTPGWREYYPGAHLVSLADLTGTIGDPGDPVHLSAADLTASGPRVAAKLAELV